MEKLLLGVWNLSVLGLTLRAEKLGIWLISADWHTN